MGKLKVYNPYKIKDYHILEEFDKNYFIYNNLKIELSPNGYIPKSGLLFDEILTENICKDKKILDLGCGYLGILSLIAYINGASYIDAVDYDENCVKWFNKIITDKKLTNIKCYKSDYFEKVVDNDFDIILTNPPQMPMLENSLHDSGGLDGRENIIKILVESIKYLKCNGYIYMLLFDFLGIEKKTNNNASITEIAKSIGYSKSEVVFECDKHLKAGGVTYENIDYINSIYPNYNFTEDDTCKCKLKILKLRK